MHFTFDLETAIGFEIKDYYLRSFGHHETVRLFLTKFSYMVL